MAGSSQNITDSYEFELVGADKIPFKGYVSSIDPTNCAPNILVQGSKNVYKKKSGTIANRPGRLLRGAIDDTLAGVLASWEWVTSLGVTIPLRVANGKLQFESKVANGINPIWYTLLSGVVLPRYVFDSWWDTDNSKDILIAVHGDSTLESWSGGIGVIASTQAPVAGTVNVSAIAAAGSSYLVGDNLTVAGGNGNFTLVVSSVNGSGGVTGVTVTNPGSGYSPNVGSATTTDSITGGAGCTITITSVQTAGSITLTGTTTAAQQGFDATGSILVNGNTYTYSSGITGSTLFGITTDPSGEPVGSVLFQTVVEHTTAQNNNTRYTGFPFKGFICDFLKVIDNRVHLGSYSSREIPISSQASYTNYTVPSPRVTGDPELLILDNTGRGISVSKGNAFISAGTKDWYEISYSQISISTTVTEQTIVDKKPTSELSAALAHEFIDTVGDDIVYLAQDQQVRVLGTFRNLNNLKIPSISQELFEELAGETFIEGFSVGQLRAIGDFVYLTAPVSGRAYIRETRETVDEQGNVVAERLWYAPFDWGVSKMAVIEGGTYFHSNANPQLYQAWDTDQWHDDSPDGNIAYDSVMQMAYRNYGRRQGMFWLNRVYYEGYMTQGTGLYGLNLLEFEGGRTSQSVVINSIEKAATFFSVNNPASLGDASLGDNPLGDGLDVLGIGQQTLPKFKAIRPLNPVNFTEHSLVVGSSSLDDRWEIICLGANAAFNGEQQAVFLSR